MQSSASCLKHPEHSASSFPVTHKTISFATNNKRTLNYNHIIAMDTFSWNRPSAMIKMSCWRGFCPVGRRAFAIAESSIPFNSFKRFTIGSPAIVLSCLKVKLEIICSRPSKISQQKMLLNMQSEFSTEQKKKKEKKGPEERKNKRYWTNV